MESKAEKRLKTITEIERLLNENCRQCPQRHLEHTNSPICQVCPVLEAIQEQGAKLARVPQKKRNRITEEEYLEAEMRGIKRATVSSRVWHRGWTTERAITEPLNATRRKKVEK